MFNISMKGLCRIWGLGCSMLSAFPLDFCDLQMTPLPTSLIDLMGIPEMTGAPFWESLSLSSGFLVWGLGSMCSRNTRPLINGNLHCGPL